MICEIFQFGILFYLYWDNNGEEKEYTILLTFDTDDDKTYYVYTCDELDSEGYIKTYAKDIVDKMKKRVIQIDKGTIVRDSKGGYNREV